MDKKNKIPILFPTPTDFLKPRKPKNKTTKDNKMMKINFLTNINPG